MSEIWFKYKQGAELPSITIDWYDGPDVDASLVPLSGHTFTLKVCATESGTAVFTKTTGITGSDTSPSVTIDWATTGEVSSLAVGNYFLQLVARRTTDSKDRYLPRTVRLAILPVMT